MLGGLDDLDEDFGRTEKSWDRFHVDIMFPFDVNETKWYKHSMEHLRRREKLQCVNSRFASL